MRILFATNDPHLPQRYAGAFVSTHELSCILRKFHFTGLLCRLVPGGGIFITNKLKRLLTGNMFPADTSLGYPVFRGWGRGSPSAVTHGLPEVIAKFKPDIVVVQGGQSFNLSVIATELGVPSAIYVRDTEFDEWDINPTAHPNIVFIANSKFTADKLKLHFGICAEFVYPLIIPDAYRVKSIRKVALFINPHPKIGLAIVLSLAAARPDVQFIFQESWALSTAHRQQLLESLSSLNNVELRMPTADMRSVYKIARLVLVPSQWEEAWGRTASEAQISGIPVLGSNRGGLPDSIGDGGITLPHDAPIDEWIKAFSALWDDPYIYKKYSENAFLRSQRKSIQPEYIAKELERIFQQCITDFHKKNSLSK